MYTNTKRDLLNMLDICMCNENCDGCKYEYSYDAVPICRDFLVQVRRFLNEEEDRGASGDLVSKEKVISVLKRTFQKYNVAYGGVVKGFSADVAENINKLPAAYDIDKVVKQIEEMRDRSVREIAERYSKGADTDKEILNEIAHYQKIIQIVRFGCVEDKER